MTRVRLILDYAAAGFTEAASSVDGVDGWEAGLHHFHNSDFLRSWMEDLFPSQVVMHHGKMFSVLGDPWGLTLKGSMIQWFQESGKPQSAHQ